MLALSQKNGSKRELNCARQTAIEAVITVEPLYWTRSCAMDDAAKTDHRTVQERLPFPLRCGLCCAAVASLQAGQPYGSPRLCHVCRLRIRRIQITRNRPGLGQTVAPKDVMRVEENRHALAFGQQGQK